MKLEKKDFTKIRARLLCILLFHLKKNLSKINVFETPISCNFYIKMLLSITTYTQFCKF